MTKERAMELLDGIVGFVTCANSTSSSIEELLKYGFTVEELVTDFGFSISDVQEVTGDEVKPGKEYYKRVYERRIAGLIHHWKLELDGIPGSDPEQAAMEDFNDDCNAAELAGYYIANYGDDAYRTWMENMQYARKMDKPLAWTERYKKVTAILEDLSGQIYLTDIEWYIPESTIPSNKLSAEKAVPYSPDAEDMAAYLSLSYGMAPKAFKWKKDGIERTYRNLSVPKAVAVSDSEQIPASAPGKTITISPELESKILDFCDDELNYHINESGCPNEYDTEISAQIELLTLLGYTEIAEKYRNEFEAACELEEV